MIDCFDDQPSAPKSIYLLVVLLSYIHFRTIKTCYSWQAVANLSQKPRNKFRELPKVGYVFFPVQHSRLQTDVPLTPCEWGLQKFATRTPFARCCSNCWHSEKLLFSGQTVKAHPTNIAYFSVTAKRFWFTELKVCVRAVAWTCLPIANVRAESDAHHAVT